MMIIANLIGYGIGIKGFEHFASRFLAFEGKNKKLKNLKTISSFLTKKGWFIVFMYFLVYGSLSLVMFAIRESETDEKGF
jgi:hypothetical protein